MNHNEIIELFNRHKVNEWAVKEGYFTNWLGLKTDASLFANSEKLSRQIMPDIPLNSDGVYGPCWEYVSLLMAIENAKDRSRFCAVELGAGWGPWISAVGIVCKRLGFKIIDLVGVEADEARAALMKQHFDENSLFESPSFRPRFLYGAAWTKDTTLKFPKIGLADHGGAASDSTSTVDYRGFDLGHVDVPAYCLKTICRGLDTIDYMHWDIQGAEWDIAKSSESFLNDRVKYLMIGTHSRPVEGHLIQFFFDNKWEILHQDPCNFIWDLNKPSVLGMGNSDGSIFAFNPRFKREFPNQAA